MKRSIFTALALIAVGLAGAAAGTNAGPELEIVRADLMAWLPGEYSSRPQRFLEASYGQSAGGPHDDWYRIFARVDVPHIGDHVIYGQLHIGTKEALIVPGTQVLYIVEIDEEHGAVNVSGRRIKDADAYAFAHLDPEKLETIALDPDYGGNCDFRWRRHGEQLVGRLAQPDEPHIDGTCTMTSKVSGVTMTWDAEWVLSPETLWIFDNGYIEGELFLGREDLTHTRLYKVRFFDCETTLETDAGSKTSTVRLHDRGDERTLDGSGLTLRLLRGPMVGPAGFGEHTLLSVRQAGGELFSQTLEHGAVNAIGLELANFATRCRLQP